MTASAIGERFVFASSHTGHETLTGKPCTLVEIYDEKIQFPYAVRFDDGTMSVAVDRQLSPIAADGSIGLPMQPAPHSRKGWDGFLTMLEHSGKKGQLWFLHPNGVVSRSVIPPTRDEMIAAMMTVPVTVCWNDGRRETYLPSREEIEASVGNYGLSASEIAHRARERAA
jgi:hypothetical protein